MTEKLFRDVEYNYQRINEQIAEAAEKSGRRREDITFLAATKTVAPEVAPVHRTSADQQGQTDCGQGGSDSVGRFV